MRTRQIIAAIAAALMLPCACVRAAELIFRPEGDGKFIYCNNPEGLCDEDMMNGEKPAYIMNNEDLEPDLYHIYLSHFNCTGDGGLGYDIELDAEITAKADTVIKIEKAFFETPASYAWYPYDGTYIMSDDSWGALNVCASMLGRSIIDPEGEDYSYRPRKYKPKTISLNRGETVWLSRYMDNYEPVKFRRGVHIQALVEIVSGKADINVAAFRTGEKPGDRSEFDKNAAFGVYKRDKCHKGIADSLPKVTAELEYTVDDDIKSGSALPVTVINQYVPEGAELDYWYTHLNPLDDKWSKYTLAESDMIQLKYRDDSKLDYYGKNVKESERDNVWVFDTHHSDTKQYEPGLSRVLADDYSPNYEMTAEDADLPVANCMGNYGVETTYRLTVRNTGKRDRYFCYYATTASDILVYDEKEGPVNQKFWSSEKKRELMYVREIPAGKTEKFGICVQLPVNYNGGIENRFVIEDSAKDPMADAEFREHPEAERSYTLLSRYRDELPPKTLEKFEGNLESFEILRGNRSYLVRWCAWDGKPGFYYYSWHICDKVYLLDDGFNIKSEIEFTDLATAAAFADGYYYIRDSGGKKYRFTKDDAKPESYSGEMPQNTEYYDRREVSDWAWDTLGKAYDAGIYLNISKNGYEPGADITRGDFCHLAVRLLRASDAEPRYYIKKKFSDTSDRDIIMLSGIGVINGYDDGTFGADDSLTREQAAAILDRLANYLDISVSADKKRFSDDEEFSDWARGSIYNMSGSGIMLGMGDGSFAPGEKYSREQSVATVWRIYDKNAKL